MVSFLDEAKGSTVVKTAAQITHEFPEIEFHQVLKAIMKTTDLWKQFEELKAFKEACTKVTLKFVIPSIFMDQPNIPFYDLLKPFHGVEYEGKLFEPRSAISVQAGEDYILKIPLSQLINLAISDQ